MDKIREMAIEFGFEGEELKQFVKEQGSFFRAERTAERELERDRLAAEKEKQDREISKDQKENQICTMDDVRGDFLGPPHGTTPAAVIANKNKTDIL